MRGSEFLRAVRAYVLPAAIIVMAAALVYTVHFAGADLEWTASLAGGLMVAAIAQAVLVSLAEGNVMRRTAQLASLKGNLENESTLRRKAEGKIAIDRQRLQLIDETMSTMVALIDADGHCRYHNRAFRDWLRSRPELIDGRHVREILGSRTYAEIATAVRQSLDGQRLHYERTQHMPNGAVYRLSVQHVPMFDNAGKVTGFYFLADDITARGDLSAPAKLEDASPGESPAAAEQEMFIDAFSEQVTGHKDAGKRIIAAIQRGEFRLYCQLISPLAIDAGEAEHYEILIRLMEEEEGMMPPGAFFPLAEKNGLMPYLDRWVVQHVLEWAAGRNQPKLRHEDSVFFINVAAATIGDPEFPDFLQAILAEYGLPGSILCFEVPDSELAIRGASAVEFIQRVRHCGCRVALSGFGRDAVSFDRIRGFQVEFLKVDGSIILDMLRDPVALAKVVSIDRVAKKIGVRTIAELVESEDLIAKLRDVGVDFAQGFGISRPRSLTE